MKLTEQRLKQIIAEEMERVNEEDKAEMPTDSASKLRTAIINLAKDANNFTGIDAKEAKLLADTIVRLLTKAVNEPAAAGLSKLITAMDKLKI
jgi:hypothetical protein